MPRPSLTEEMEDAMGDVEWLLAQNARLRSRLTALETELEGYRNRENTWSGRVQARAAQARSNLRDTIQFGNEVIARSDKPVTLEDMGFQRTIPTAALPCPSEYVNAQTGYDREDGG